MAESFEGGPLDTRDVIVISLRNDLSSDPFYPVEDVHELLGWVFRILLKLLGAKEELFDRYG
jgi:hypothetical protein